MKKVRISKKNPARILKAIQIRTSPNKQFLQLHKSIENSKNFQKLSHHQNIIHSHRYKPSEPSLEIEKRKQGYSPRQNIVYRSLERQLKSLSKYRRLVRGIRDLANRSNQKSPYLQRNLQNKSERKLILSSRNITQSGRNINKQQKKFRFNSPQQKQTSLQIKKTSDSQNVLKQAKKLMLAGQSRKSMFILKSLLARQPSNLNALHVGAANLYNIGDYQKCLQYLDHILLIKKDFNINVYLLYAKVYLKLEDVNQCLLKLNECIKVFPEYWQAEMEKGQVYLSLHKFKQALQCFKRAEKIDPKNIQIVQKIIYAYQGLGQHEKMLQAIKKFPSLSQKLLKISYQSMIKLKRYQQLILNHSASTNPLIVYLYAYALYKTGDSLKSYLILESSLINSDDCSKSIKLMLLIHCKNNDYYEASHLKQRCQHISITTQQLKYQFSFIEGAICLMKRNTFQGVQLLNTVKQHLKKILQQPKHKKQPQQFIQFMGQQINMFLGYGYFCLGNYQQSQSHYQLQIKQYPNIMFDGMKYNMQLNRGYMCYSDNKLQQVQQIFVKLSQNNKHKIQPYFCSAIVNINLFVTKKAYTGISDLKHLQKAKQIFSNSLHLVSKFNNNIGANYLYHKSVLHATLQQWKEAMSNVDEAIEKSQQNYWRYYYLRAVILACVHNFSQAINDCTAAISLNDLQASPYYLRSCCFQIQGQGNYAFKDLQSYIALRPQDKDIHKFAGKLLFQNGAFEDAIAAFNHQLIPDTIQNQDVFLTKSKTFFLLGRFIQASQQMLKVFAINPNRQEAQFDGNIMLIVHKILKPGTNYKQIIQQIKKLYQERSNNFIKSQIFKKTQLYTLQSICYFYVQNYTECIIKLQQAISAKQKLILKESLIQGAIREDQKESRMFVNQMYFNISICHLILKDIENAKQTAGKMVLSSNDVFYQPYGQYMRILSNKKKQLLQKEQEVIKLQIFPSRNKISNYLKQVVIKVNDQKIATRLCIPFPKVQPPQIFPKFDDKLLEQFTLQRVQRKSEAPWICHQQNAIKFTNKIQKYSRLQIEDSINESSITDIDDSHMNMKSVNSRKSKTTMPKIGKNISYSSASGQRYFI